MPVELKGRKITRYVEPFIGGGAVFFSLNRNFAFDQYYICDVNEELILTYRIIHKSGTKNNLPPGNVRIRLSFNEQKERKEIYYEIRDIFNQKHPEINFRKYSSEWIERTAQIIFLNRTCYNGLFRVNRKGEFNVPFGRYKNPDILYEDNLKDVAILLKRQKLLSEISRSVENLLISIHSCTLIPPIALSTKPRRLLPIQGTDIANRIKCVL